MKDQRVLPPEHTTRALFENMPILGDEAVWDLLDMLCALIDAYEEHYAEQLQRLRLQRYQELHRETTHENQLHLPLHEWGDEPF